MSTILPDTHSQKKVAVIGAGSAKGQEYFEALSKRKDVKIVACVVNQTIPTKIKESQVPIITGGDVQKLLNEIEFDIAVVSLPHNLHDQVTRALLQKGVGIIKEKPLALKAETAQDYINEVRTRALPPIFTTVQRGSHPVYQGAKRDMAMIGEPTGFTYTYTMNLPNQTSGWRADKEIAGGGVVIDMGYHAIDVINDFFGIPQNMSAKLGYKYPEMEAKLLEDMAEVTFEYSEQKRPFTGSLILSRHAEKKEEILRIQGTLGSLVVMPTKYEIFNNDGLSVKCVDKSQLSKLDIIQSMFDVALSSDTQQTMCQFMRNVENMTLIDKIYRF